jgi:hypothetical protein
MGAVRWARRRVIEIRRERKGDMMMGFCGDLGNEALSAGRYMLKM